VFGVLLPGSSEHSYHLNREYHDYYDQEERDCYESQDDLHQSLHATLLHHAALARAHLREGLGGLILEGQPIRTRCVEQLKLG
jgi:hypothetical protein